MGPPDVSAWGSTGLARGHVTTVPQNQWSPASFSSSPAGIKYGDAIGATYDGVATVKSGVGSYPITAMALQV